MEKLTPSQIEALIARGCMAESWNNIYVSSDFSANQLFAVRMSGRVEIGSNVRIANSYVANYTIDEGTTIEDVTRVECRHESSFGNGVEVATINENGGRKILIYDQLRAQTAYIWALYRHRKTLCQKLQTAVEEYAENRRSAMGHIGRNVQIIGAGMVRECDIRDNVTIDGASLLENATILERGYVGIDVKARNTIMAEDSRVDSGAILDRVFVGECAIVAAGFSAVDSLIFSSSHLENGEAAAIFAGAFTVSHHKSSLLIAGMFSFFNAGSGSNQSNHLFKSGAVHQAIHPRGCKFASGAYIMAPATEGAFTMVKGHHEHFHDTSAFPYSYLMEGENGGSKLLPGANLVSYGTSRDIAKWLKRDRRTLRRDPINYEECNPYITGAMLRAVNTLHQLQEEGANDRDEYIWGGVVIKKTHVQRGEGLYNKAIAASIGEMLSHGEYHAEMVSQSEWVDVAGAYMPMAIVDRICADIESGAIAELHEIDDKFMQFHADYANYAHTWARGLLSQLMGGEVDDQTVAQMIASSKRVAEELNALRLSDMERDASQQMTVGYGHDAQRQEEREADFRAVRGL